MWSTLRTLAAIAMLSLATAKPLSQSIAAVASSDAVPAAVPAAAAAAAVSDAEDSEKRNTTVPEATTNATVPITTVPVTTANTSTVAPVIANDEQPAADDQSSSSNAEQQTAEEGGEYAGVGDEPAAEGNADSKADAEGNADSNDAAAAADPCKAACTPKIDVKASVMEAYKRKRAHVAVIGDWGSCGPAADREGQYSWSVDWGDDASQEQKMDRMGPYQAEHIYQKKGKYTIETTFCHHTDIDGCDDGCKTYEKKLNVKP